MKKTDIDGEIWKAYREYKRSVREAALANDINRCLEDVGRLWQFMNRFRNCDLGHYFDEDIHEWVANLNPRKNIHNGSRQRKKNYRIAFVLVSLSDTGGASMPHRFMLNNFNRDGAVVENYVLISNYFKRELVDSESLRYLTDKIRPEQLTYLPSELSDLDRGEAIEQWILDHEIDFVVADTCPSSLYALASRPAPVIANLSQDCYTFSLGPGTSDITYLITRSQLFTHRFGQAHSNHRTKLVMLPIHAPDYIYSAEKISRTSLGLPEGAVISGSSNLWKSFFGDSDIFARGISNLLRKHQNYHHIFIGTSRCLDNLNVFLASNPDIRDRIHYIGPVENIYRILKTIDFWVNSFPTSGGSDLEMAMLGKPTLELIDNRNLNLHPLEFLCSYECVATSMAEFETLGSKLIEDVAYRDNLGTYLQARVAREFDKNSLVGGRIYGWLIDEFLAARTNGQPDLNTEVEDSIRYEKRIALYNAHGSSKWSFERRFRWLSQCTDEFPRRPFGWIKLLEEVIKNKRADLFLKLRSQVLNHHNMDYRVHLLLSKGCEILEGDVSNSTYHMNRAVELGCHAKISQQQFSRVDHTRAGVTVATAESPLVEEDLKICNSGLLPYQQSDDLPSMFYNY